MGRPPRRPAAVQPPARPGACARAAVRHACCRHGKEVAAWGEPDRADLTFSVAKTYLALLAGVAQRQGLLPDEDEPRRRRGCPASASTATHNRAVTWTHLLTQTSEWEGSRSACPTRSTAGARSRRTRIRRRARRAARGPCSAPGSYWEYNDVRINQLALALLHLFRRPLPEVFLEHAAAAARRRRRLRAGAATTMPGSSCPASAGCSRCPAARTGAPASRSARATRRASASCCSTAAPPAAAS